MSSQKPEDNTRRQVAKFSGLGIQMAVIISLGTWFGTWLDGEDSEFALYTLIFSLLSVFIALYLVIKEVLNSSK